MTAEWILCLAMVSQVPQYAPPSSGWQPGGTQASSNPAMQPATSQPTSAFGQPSRFATSNNGQQQPMGVVQYAQPIGPSPYPTQQPQTQPQSAQQFAQHNWPTGNPQFTNQQQTPAANGWQNSNDVGAAQFDNRWGQTQGQAPANGQTGQPQQVDPRYNNQPAYQVAQAQPQGTQNYANQQGQPTPAWGQPNPSLQPPPTQPTAPTLLAPQNARPTQNQPQYQPQNQQQGNWATQPQQNQSVLTGAQQGQNWQSPTQPTHGTQFTGGVNGQYGQAQQIAGTQQPIAPPQYNSAAQQDPRLGDPSIGSGTSRFGAPINSGDNQIQNASPQIDHRQGQPPTAWPSIQANDAGQPYSPRLVADTGNDASNQINSPNGALHPTLHSTLPNGAEQSGDNRQGELTPYARAEPPRADGQRQPSDLTVTDSRWADVNSSGQTSGAVRVPFVSGVGDTRNQPAGYSQPISGQSAPRDGLFAPAAGVSAAAHNHESESPSPYEPTTAIIVSLIGLFFSLAANLYLGWIAFESHFRYRRLLVEGDDYDDSRRGGHDDEGGSRRR